MIDHPLHPHLASSDVFADLPKSLLERLEPELELVRLEPHDVLVRQGEDGDALYVLISGSLEVRIATERGGSVTVDRLDPGVAVGEMSLVAGQKRSATVIASETAELVRLSRGGFERLALETPELYRRVMRVVAPRLQRIQLSGVLETWFDAVDSDEIHALQDAVTWVHVTAGERLYERGDPADGMYLLVSGHLRLEQGPLGDGTRSVREIGRGESFGEDAVFDDAPRAETVVAARDSHLVRLERELVTAHPGVIARIAHAALKRARPEARAGERDGNGTRTFALVPADEGSPVAEVARLLSAQLRRWGRVLRLDAAAVDEAFGRPGVAHFPLGSASEALLTHWLNERERAHDYLVFEADASASAWTRRCLRQADAVLVVAEPHRDPTPGAAEREAARFVRSAPQLVLVQPDAAELPARTAAWLEPRSPGPVHHLRLGVESDAARLARRLTGRAVGLVFSGGGARGYTHIGLLRAIEELGLPIDFVAGTSMGALVAGGYALKREYQFCYETAVAFGDPKRLLDRTLPMVALMESRGVTTLFREMFADTRIEDLWIPFFCVSANLTRAEPTIHERGQLWQAVRASTAIPGIFTPVIHEGDVHVDGGVMNNFPVDLMRDRVGPGTVIGSNAYTQSSESHAYDFGPSVSGWEVLLRRVVPGVKRKRYPSMLGTLMRATSLSSKHLSESARLLGDLVIQYPTQGYGNLDFGRSEELIELGYRLGREELEAWLEARLEREPRDDRVAARG